MLRLVLPAVFALAAGCGASRDDGAATPDAAPDGPIGGPREVRYERFIGRLAATPSVTFGGDPYCTYRVTLRDVVLDLAISAEELATMTIADTMVETIVGSCPFAPAPSNRQLFDHRGGPRQVAGDGTVQPALAGLAANQPLTGATAMLRVAGGSADASLTWERLDQGPPLKWVVATTTPVPLARASCEVDDLYCLGGTEGALFRCRDGIQLELLDRCPAGCPPSPLPSAEPHADEACR